MLSVTSPLPEGPELHVALRAERLLLPGEYGKGCNRIPAKLSDVIYQGDSLLLLAEIAGGHCVSIRKTLRGGPVPRGFAAGQAIELGLAPEATIVVPH